MPEAITSCYIRPYYEDDHLWHWEVLLNPEQVRPGCFACDEIHIYVEEHEAREFVHQLKSENPEMRELAVVPSRCPKETNLETQQ